MQQLTPCRRVLKDHCATDGTLSCIRNLPDPMHPWTRKLLVGVYSRQSCSCVTLVPHTQYPANRGYTHWPHTECLTCPACVPSTPQGKFKPLKFSCKHRQLLLTDLYQCMAAANALGRCLLATKVLG